MQCPYCGNDVPPGVSTCPSCGASMPADSFQPSRSAVTPQTQYARPSASYGQGTAKSQTVYVILGILLGYFGVHDFYAGYTGKGVAQLLISVLSCGAAAWVSWIWAIVEICTVKQDAKGIPFV